MMLDTKMTIPRKTVATNAPLAANGPVSSSPPIGAHSLVNATTNNAKQQNISALFRSKGMI